MNKQIYIFGTIATIQFESDIADKVMEEILSLVYRIDDDMSIFKEESIVSNINRMAGKSEVKVSDEIMYIVEKSLEYSKRTNGELDITSKPIIDIVKSNNGNINDIESKLKLVNYKNVIIDKENSTINLKYEGMGIDLGSMVKGYATDAIVDIFNKYNIKNALIDLGGNVYVKGSKENNEKWSVGVQDPFGDTFSNVGYLKLSDKSIVTSGNYERINNIVSPRTGLLVNHNIASVTIISDKSIDGEGLSTGCYLLGIEKGINLIESLEDIDAIFITSDKKIFCTNNIKNDFIVLNNEYELINGGKTIE